VGYPVETEEHIVSDIHDSEVLLFYMAIDQRGDLLAVIS
jgi:hypothetical protein